jgi:hypothetical protein
MAWTLYEFLDTRGRGVIEVWLKDKRFSKEAIARLNQKIDLLEQSGPQLSPKLFAGTKGRHIFKLKVKAPKMQLRPLFCRGPLSTSTEFTLLLGAVERNNKFDPVDAPARAADNRQTILNDPQRRRLHEHNF